VNNDFAGLPGHRRYLDTLGTTLRASGPQRLVGVLLVRVHHFQRIKINHGHDLSDWVIRSLAERTVTVLRDDDTIERIEDGCLALILPNLSGSAQAELAASGILKICRAPFLCDNGDIDLKVDIGLALYPNDAASATELLRCAELAVGRANESSAGYSVYTATLEDRRGDLHNFLLERELEGAVRRDEFHLCFQAKVSLRDGALAGAEALLRWTRADGETIPPDVFIPIAEKSNLIVGITLWTLNTALRACGDLFERNPDFSVAVNLSPIALNDPEIFPLVSQAANIWCADRHKLVLEITESALFKDTEAALLTLEKFHSEGIRLSIDDFGTGYSSLSQLGRMRVAELKIDKSFVHDVTLTERNAQIVRSVIDLAHNFGMTVVAEGIEDRATYEFLAELGCDYGQGYYIARPMSMALFEEWAEAHREPVREGRYRHSDRLAASDVAG
jgi:diguanylate cyclase